MNKLQISFGFGCDFQGDGRPILKHEKQDGLAEIRAKAVTLFGGCTIIHTEGDWLDPDTGVLFSETGATVVVLTDLPPVKVAEQILVMVRQIKDSLKQKAVAVTKQVVNSEII